MLAVAGFAWSRSSVALLLATSCKPACVHECERCVGRVEEARATLLAWADSNLARVEQRVQLLYKRCVQGVHLKPPAPRHAALTISARVPPGRVTYCVDHNGCAS